APETPAPRAIARARVVFPAPRSPRRTITSGVRAALPTRSPQAVSRGSDKVWVDRWISRRAFGLPSAFVGNVAGRADSGYPVGHRASTRRRTSTSPSPPHRPHARRATPLLSAALHRRLHLEELIAEHRGALEVQSRG